jgi:hypothetical protein
VVIGADHIQIFGNSVLGHRVLPWAVW